MDQADLGLAWPLTEPILRLVLAQDWVWTNRHHPDIGHDQDWDTIAHGLAACPPAHPLWDAFAHQVLYRWHRSWPGFSTLTWRARDEPEVAGLDTEMVTFVERDGGWSGDDLEPAGEDGGRRFAMRHTRRAVDGRQRQRRARCSCPAGRPRPAPEAPAGGRRAAGRGGQAAGHQTGDAPSAAPGRSAHGHFRPRHRGPRAPPAGHPISPARRSAPTRRRPGASAHR